MGSMLSSPGKQAAAAASAQQGISQQMIQEIENYTNQQQQQLRGAVSGIGVNPFFQAANYLSPTQYAINPTDTVTFATQGPQLSTISAPPSPTIAPPMQAPPPQAPPSAPPAGPIATPPMPQPQPQPMPQPPIAPPRGPINPGPKPQPIEPGTGGYQRPMPL